MCQLTLVNLNEDLPPCLYEDRKFKRFGALIYNCKRIKAWNKWRGDVLVRHITGHVETTKFSLLRRVTRAFHTQRLTATSLYLVGR